ncbi:hypothetical protein CDD82_7665 [Ophiocordyceps australis]|uniref:Uncharacterized protein n=1 Tax=Ophiocordyceps australis TaxID=1399860 RepID=A0A2C5XEJ7_9HYPO|nr:hypothetical protein CDD82_7665 [Ophiocordyceps australis]
MKPSRLILLIAACVAHAQGSYKKAVINHYITRLEAKASIDWNNPPVFEEKRIPPHCMRSRIDAPLRPVMARKRLRRQDASLSVDYDIVPQLRFLNLEDHGVQMRQEDSTWVTKGTSQSWNAGAGFALGRLQLSGGYSSSRFESEMKIKSLGLTEECPAGNECHFEDWVYHVNFWGVPEPGSGELSNKYEANICSTLGRKKTCFANWARKVCIRLQRAVISERVPIHDGASKKILTTTVFIREYYGPHATAIVAQKECLFKLDDGRWYDSENDTFSTGEGWAAREPDQRKPVIPNHVRLADCPASKDKVKDDRLGKRGDMEEERKMDIKWVGGFHGR